ncbi:hypothetical protein CHS0354_030861 [Potamilus streckersoni]|uniref:Mitochondria-eating protein C-terminal domain-containing protein n=1 Tax=Potamilus streckersoni TaxID=2493646 RepID=A0AAE0SMQ1_9BIVA|nr:hypothetical protein CHS0354_030861 [Potamilus streckersoni]
MARSQRKCALKVINEYIGSNGDGQDLTVLEVMRTLTDARKKNVEELNKAFKKRVETTLTKKTIYSQTLSDIKPYLDECVEICILMNIQEPPLELRGLMHTSFMSFDSSAFKPYTESGKTIEYIVWPAIHLYLDGPILCKGIAQGKRDSSNAHDEKRVQQL